jgi:lipopolysaccharide export system protein LptA
MKRKITGAAALIALALAGAGPLHAQPATLSVGGGGAGGGPIDVISESGFEFHQSERVAVARGGVVATQGDLTVRADVMAAYFRRKPDGTNEIYRLSAEGGVQVGTAEQTAYGDRAVYDVDQRVAVLTGGDLRLVTAEDSVTAAQSLEFWRDQNLAVARGDAVAMRGDNKVRADRLVGLMEANAAGNLELSRIDAEGGVVITTPTEVARGQRGTYDLKSRRATLAGEVSVSRGANLLTGAAAEVDLEAGTSRVLAGPAAAGEQARVRGLFIPDPGNGAPPPVAATSAPATSPETPPPAPGAPASDIPAPPARTETP